MTLTIYLNKQGYVIRNVTSLSCDNGILQVCYTVDDHTAIYSVTTKDVDSYSIKVSD